MTAALAKYVFKPDAHSSHSVILSWLPDGRNRRILDVGANDRVLRHITRIRIPREVNIEIELTD